MASSFPAKMPIRWSYFSSLCLSLGMRSPPLYKYGMIIVFESKINLLIIFWAFPINFTMQEMAVSVLVSCQTPIFFRGFLIAYRTLITTPTLQNRPLTGYSNNSMRSSQRSTAPLRSKPAISNIAANQSCLATTENFFPALDSTLVFFR